jgi:hypothetical protein
LRECTPRIRSRPTTSGGLTTGPQQRRIELVEQVGRGDHHDVLLGGVEAVHLDQQLVQRLVALTGDVHSAAATDGVELIDEHDRRGVLARDPEQPADPGGAEAREHLHERGGRLRVERRAGLVGHRLGQQRLAGSRRPVQQDSLRHLRAQGAEAHGVTQVLDDLLELLLGLLGTGDLAPADRRRGLRLDLDRFGLRHVAHQREDGDDQQAHEQDGQPMEHERLNVWLPEEIRESHA